MSVIGSVCLRAHELKDIKAGESLATPSHLALKSVTMFLAIEVGSGAGACAGGGGGDDFGPAWVTACSKATVIIAGTSDSMILLTTMSLCALALCEP